MDIALAIALLFLVVGIWMSPKGTFRSFFKITPEFKKPNVWIVSLGALLVLKVIAIFLPELENPESEKIGKLLNMVNVTTLEGWAIILIGGVIVPIVEEIWFRGWALQPFFKSRKLLIVGVGIVSILFAMVHSQPYEKVFTGMTYSFIRIKQRSLLGSITLHIGINFPALFFLGIVNAGAVN